MIRFRLGVDDRSGNRQLNIKALFAALDIPWDDTHSRDVFEQTIARLEVQDRQTLAPETLDPAGRPSIRGW